MPLPMTTRGSLIAALHSPLRAPSARWARLDPKIKNRSLEAHEAASHKAAALLMVAIVIDGDTALLNSSCVPQSKCDAFHCYFNVLAEKSRWRRARCRIELLPIACA